MDVERDGAIKHVNTPAIERSKEALMNSQRTSFSCSLFLLAPAKHVLQISSKPRRDAAAPAVDALSSASISIAPPIWLL